MRKQKIIGIGVFMLVLFSTISVNGIYVKNHSNQELDIRDEKIKTKNIQNLKDTFQNKLSKISTILENNKALNKDVANDPDENKYYVAVGPVGANKFTKCETIAELCETEYKNFENDVKQLKSKSLNSYDFMAEQLKIFIKYDIFPNYFTLDNITKAIEEYKEMNYNNNNKNRLVDDDNIQIGRTTIGPHMILYGSILSSVTNFQPMGQYLLPEPFSGINRIIDIFNISEGSGLYDLFFNTTIFHYLGYIPVEILIGGSLGSYLSLGLFPGIPSYSIKNTPFIGIYMFFFAAGVYIYQGHERDDDDETSVFDLLIIAPKKFQRECQQLIDHKLNQNVKTIIKTTKEIYNNYDGNDKQEKIKYCIKQNYDEYKIGSVLLIGDFIEVPVRYCYNNDGYLSMEPYFISDLYYADIYDENGNFSSWDTEGDSLYGEWNGEHAEDKDISLTPEVSIGRLPCSNRFEVKTMINKIINYETETDYDGWFHRFVVAGGDTYSAARGYDEDKYDNYEGEQNLDEAVNILFMEAQMYGILIHQIALK